MFKLSSFDLFPKVDPRYLRATSPGGFTTVLLTLVMALLTLFEVYRYMTPIPVSTILIENRVDHRLTMTLDISVASPCDALVVEVEDCHGGKVKVNSLLEATRIKFLNLNTTAEASGVTASGNTSTGSFFESLFDPMAEAGQFGSEREGCRITGTLPMDDVSGKLLITPILQLHLGFTGLSTNLKDVNLSHVIHDMSFGRPFPGRVNPLEDRMEAAPHAFYMYQYFISVIPTTTTLSKDDEFLLGFQYAVHPYTRALSSQKPGSVGISFVYDKEPLVIHIAPNNEPLLELMIRLAGMFSGIFIVSHGIHAGIMKVWLKSSLDVQAEQVVPLLALGK